ncbi:MAG: VWA domain-containing protein [Planctomycetes bacterium]|nr:VWA domain-containing protein [Planctomycetota bacterium]
MNGGSVSQSLALVFALAALLLAEAWRRRRRRRVGIAFADSSWLRGLPSSGRDRWARALPYLRLATLALLALALADPAVERRAAEESHAGVDLLVTLDQSSSMTVVLPGSFASRRFDAARAAIRRFAVGREGDRIGLTTFAKYPRLRCPLTWDHALFESCLDELTTVQDSTEDLTAIGVALADGAQRLSTRAGTKVLVLVTDGASNHGSIDPLEGAALCRAEGVRVYAIALGGGEEFGSGRTAPDRALLEAIASQTGGVAFHATDESGLQAAWRTIDALEQAPIVRREGVVGRPIATRLMLIAVIILLALAAGERAALRSLP